jgi:AmiR/NasT family two-component response regulator
MVQRLRIAVADDELDMRRWLEETLSILGHEVTIAAETGRQLVDHCLQSPPDLVITDIKMPDMDGIEAAAKLAKQQPVPVILVSAYHEEDLIERAVKDHVLAYLVKPIKQADLETSIALAVRRFKEFRALQQQADDLQEALESRKVVERAKGILMRRADLAEEEAFRRLQKLSSEKNVKMVEIARMIVTAEEAML